MAKEKEGFFSENEAKLLWELSKNSSQSNGRLAEKLGIHLTTVRRVKKTLEEKIGLRYSISFDPLSIPDYRLYYVFQKLSPGVRDNEEVNRKMEKYYEGKSFIVGYGKCMHGKWDAFTIFYCDENKFDEYFADFKSRVNLMTEDMDVIKVTQPLPCGISKMPIEAVLDGKKKL